MKFTIKAAPFGAALTNVLPHAGTEDTLPVLKAVRVRLDEAGELVVEATDRYSLGEQVIPHDNTVLADGFEPGAVLVPLAFAKDAAKALKPSPRSAATFVNFEVVDGRIRLDYGTGTLSTLPVDGEFPKVERLWDQPSAKGVTRVGLGAWQVAKFAKVVDGDGRPIRKPTLELTYTEAGKPAIVAVSSLDNFRALLMPVRLSEAA